eukprot:2980537-Rhodomonas_salina.1
MAGLGGSSRAIAAAGGRIQSHYCYKVYCFRGFAHLISPRYPHRESCIGSTCLLGTFWQSRQMRVQNSSVVPPTTIVVCRVAHFAPGSAANKLEFAARRGRRSTPDQEYCGTLGGRKGTFLATWYQGKCITGFVQFVQRQYKLEKAQYEFVQSCPKKRTFALPVLLVSGPGLGLTVPRTR